MPVLKVSASLHNYRDARPVELLGRKKEMKRVALVKPCPFCGSLPSIEPWHGGKPTKKMISCDNVDCHVAPQVTGENKSEAVDRWNKRNP